MKKEKSNKWRLKEPMYVEKTDKRYKEYKKQLEKNGFSDTETWNLNGVIAEFVLPRLKRFKETCNGYPGDLTEDKWSNIIDEMIFAFEWELSHKEDKNLDLEENELKSNWNRYRNGLYMFAKYFSNLWW